MNSVANLFDYYTWLSVALRDTGSVRRLLRRRRRRYCSGRRASADGRSAEGSNARRPPRRDRGARERERGDGAGYAARHGPQLPLARVLGRLSGILVQGA